MHELENFIQSMKDEAGHLISFASLEEEMQRLVGERRWDGLENAILRLRKKSDAVDRSEEERVRSFQMLKVALGIPDNAGFFKLLPFIQEENRRTLTEAYRKLKLAVYAVKGATLRLSYYFQSYSETVKKIMGEIFPHRKGKLYSHTGRPTGTIDERLVLDKHM
ncbi:MAG: hypothetical protein JXD23_04775 [Spirochaetales bacterium]|nr:hypothetical protein [Spirochaetales bacterium]